MGKLSKETVTRAFDSYDSAVRMYKRHVKMLDDPGDCFSRNVLLRDVKQVLEYASSILIDLQEIVDEGGWMNRSIARKYMISLVNMQSLLLLRVVEVYGQDALND